MWLPPSLEQKARDMGSQHDAQLRASVELQSSLDRWNLEVKRVDPYLEVVKASQNATLPGLKAGYFHIVRNNPGGPASFIVHEGPHGEFRDLDSSILETLSAGDMWSDRSMKERDRLAEQARRAKDHAKEREVAERREEIRERLASKDRVQIVVPR